MKKITVLLVAAALLFTACNPQSVPAELETPVDSSVVSETTSTIGPASAEPSATEPSSATSETTAAPETTTPETTVTTSEPPETPPPLEPTAATAELPKTATTPEITPTAKPPASTSTPKPKTTTPTPEPPAVALKTLINDAPLSPMATQNQEMDKKINQIIGQEGSTYDKIVRCYDWLVKNVTYTVLFINASDGSYLPNSHPDCYGEYGNFGGDYLMMGYHALMNSQGVCDNYSCAFVLMARAIGLEAYAYTGQVKSKVGGYTGHTWAGIVLDGTIYAFDPQVEQNNPGANGAITYTYFGKTKAQTGTLYKWESSYSTLFGEKNIINYYKNRGGKWDFIISSAEDIERLINADPLKLQRGGTLVLTGLLPKKDVDEALNKYYNVPVAPDYISESVMQVICDSLLRNAVNYQYTDVPVNPDLKPSDLTVTSVCFELKFFGGLFGMSTPGTVEFGSDWFGISVYDSSTGYTYNRDTGNTPELFSEIVKTHPAYK